MKKLIIGIGSILIMTLIVVLFVNANNTTKDPEKVKTEVKKDATAVPCSSACDHSGVNKTKNCDPAKCKEMNCSHKDGKCDPATCTAHKECEQKKVVACGSKAACPETCKAKLSEEK